MTASGMTASGGHPCSLPPFLLGISRCTKDTYKKRVINNSWAPGTCTAAYLKQRWTKDPRPSSPDAPSGVLCRCACLQKAPTSKHICSTEKCTCGLGAVYIRSFTCAGGQSLRLPWAGCKSAPHCGLTCCLTAVNGGCLALGELVNLVPLTTSCG